MWMGDGQKVCEKTTRTGGQTRERAEEEERRVPEGTLVKRCKRHPMECQKGHDFPIKDSLERNRYQWKDSFE